MAFGFKIDRFGDRVQGLGLTILRLPTIEEIQRETERGREGERERERVRVGRYRSL